MSDAAPAKPTESKRADKFAARRTARRLGLDDRDLWLCGDFFVDQRRDFILFNQLATPILHKMILLEQRKHIVELPFALTLLEVGQIIVDRHLDAARVGYMSEGKLAATACIDDHVAVTQHALDEVDIEDNILDCAERATSAAFRAERFLVYVDDILAIEDVFVVFVFLTDPDHPANTEQRDRQPDHKRQARTEKAQPKRQHGPYAHQ